MVINSGITTGFIEVTIEHIGVNIVPYIFSFLQKIQDLIIYK